MAFNLGNLPGIDPSILMSQTHAMSDALNQGLMGYQNGLKMKQERTAQQREEEDHQRKIGFRDALQEVYPTVDYHTPEGQTAIIQHLAQKGYAPEAMELSKEFPKPPPNSFTFQDTPAGWMSGNQQTGTMTQLGNIPSEKKDTKQAEDKFDSMKGTLDKFMTPPATGWDPLKGEKANALSKAIAYMPADVLKTKVAQDWINNNKAEQQNQVFNPAFAQGRDIPSLRTRSTGNAKTYKGAKDALNAAEGDYTNYLKDPNAPTNRVDQQGIIDKYTAVSLGKAPTEAQLELAQAFPGIESWFDLASGKLKTGQIIPKAAVDEMMRNMRKTVINYGSTLKQQNATDTEAASLGGVDPARILAIPDNVITQDSTRFANAPGQNPGVGKYSPMVIDLAKKALADPNATAKHKADAKKILGLP